MTPASTPIKVLVADDHGLFRTGLVRMLAADPRFQVVGEGKNGLEAVELAVERKPDVVLMDIQMPEVNGVDAIKLLKARAPEVEVIVLSAYAEGAMISEAIANGARGFLNKDSRLEEVASRILDAKGSQRFKSFHSMQTALSRRELHILKHVAAGLTNKQIAAKLGISEKTVRNHLSRVFSKLRATNRTEAVMNAMRFGIQVV